MIPGIPRPPTYIDRARVALRIFGAAFAAHDDATALAAWRLFLAMQERRAG